MLVSENYSNSMQSRAEAKVDLVSNWRQKFSRHYVEPEEILEPIRPVATRVKRKKVPSVSGENKVPVINLLSKLAGDGAANLTRRPSFDDKLNYATHLSLLVPEDKLKPRDDASSDHIERRGSDVDSGSLASFGDVSISSAQSNSTIVSSLGLNHQMANRAFHIDVLQPSGAPFRCERTIHEMLFEIETAARLNKPSPAYIPKLHELDPGTLAWDGNSVKKNKKKSRDKADDGSVASESLDDISTVSSMNGNNRHPSKLSSKSAASQGISPQQQQQQQQQPLPPVKSGVKFSSTTLPEKESFSPSSHGSVPSPGSASGSPLVKAASMPALSPISATHSSSSPSNRNHTSSDVNVNVLGCLKSVELVLAQAELRSRKMKETMDSKEKFCIEQRQNLEYSLQLKATRSERHAIAMARTQRQVDWLRILVLCCCLRRMHPFSLVKKAGTHVHTKLTHLEIRNHASEIIYRAVKRWWERVIYVKYRKGFASQLKKYKLQIELGIRIGRKRRAIKKIKELLIACQGYQKLQMKQVVSNFLRAVRCCQRFIRSFLLCKYSRILAISSIWDKIELPYIKRKIKEREELRNVAVSNKTFELPKEFISEQARIEMKAQAKKWTMIDGKMEESLQKHRLQGNLKQKSSEEVILKLKAPEYVRVKIIKTIIEQKRKEYLLKREADIRSYMSKISVFSPEDALSLIRGNDNVVDRIVNKSSIKVPVKSRTVDPFLLYAHLNHQAIFNKIKKTHDELGTFVIKLEKNNSNRFAKRYAKLKQQQHNGEDSDIAGMSTKDGGGYGFYSTKMGSISTKSKAESKDDDADDDEKY